METKKSVLVISDKITELVEAWKIAERSKGYDARKLCYKNAKTNMDFISNEIKAEFVEQVKLYLEANNIALKYKVGTETNEFKIEVYTSLGMREFSPSASICGISIDVSVEELKDKMREIVIKYQSETKVESDRIDVADKMLQLVKDDYTFKDSSWAYDDGKTDKWNGSQLSMRVKDYQDDWHKNAKIQVHVLEANKLMCEFEISQEFTSVEEAKVFWDDAKKFIESHGRDFVKEKRY